MRTKKILLSVLLCAGLVVWGITVAYASITVTLNIEGTTYINPSSWNISFKNIVQADLNNATENQAPSLDSDVATISGFNITFNGLDAYVEYEVDIVNNGTFDAVIDTVQLLTPTCTGSGANAATDEALVCGNFVSLMTYEDGTAIATGNTLDAGETKKIKLRYTYTTDDKPEETVNITDLGLSIVYVQAP